MGLNQFAYKVKKKDTVEYNNLYEKSYISKRRNKRR